jgi:hypothetical protein
MAEDTNCTLTTIELFPVVIAGGMSKELSRQRKFESEPLSNQSPT